MVKTLHKSVLLDESLELLNIKKGETYIDATFGGGGHTKKILDLDGRVLGIDVDPQAIREASKEHSISLSDENGYLMGRSEKLFLAQGNFADLELITRKFGVRETPGIIFDLGFSSTQIEGGVSGLSFQRDESLDMRFDPKSRVNAADLLNGLGQGELNELFIKYGEEPASRLYARAIVQARIKKKIETSGQLAKIIEEAAIRRGKIHPATRVFQAIRIAVNDELNNLQKGLSQATNLLESRGRIVLISFHSLEDRIVKNFFNENNDLEVLTRKPVVPNREEVLENPRSRSAKLRAAERN